MARCVAVAGYNVAIGIHNVIATFGKYPRRYHLVIEIYIIIDGLHLGNFEVVKAVGVAVGCELIVILIEIVPLTLAQQVARLVPSIFGPMLVNLTEIRLCDHILKHLETIVNIAVMFDECLFVFRDGGRVDCWQFCAFLVLVGEHIGC